MRIRLLGPPAILDADGQPRDLRGNQAWAVLARVLLSSRPIARRDLAAEIFPETDDPLGALRWCLAALRRAIGGACLAGDPIDPALPEGVSVDLHALHAPGFAAEEAGDLLEHTEIRAGTAFETWLLVERERLRSEVLARLLQDAMRAIAAGDLSRAIRLAEAATRRSPFDEAPHILLVRALVLAGRHEAAARHVQATERAFLAELGEKPSPALRSAARRSLAAPPEGVALDRAVEMLIESGSAALAAGAVEAGLDCLRRAAEDAAGLRDDRLQAHALGRLGAALVHAVRGHDDEGAILLRQSVALARRAGAADIAVSSLRELGYADALVGRRPAAAATLREALETGANDPEALAGVHGVIAFNLVDWGRAAEGLDHYAQALDLARRAGALRREAWLTGLGCWGQLAAGDPARAIEWAARSQALCQEIRWLSFRPWPMAVASEAALAQGQDPAALLPGIEEAIALSTGLCDPCWEAANARVKALALLALGEAEEAAACLSRARARCETVTDFYAAMRVAVIADQLGVSRRAGDARRTAELARELLVLAARTHADGHLHAAMAAVGAGG